MCTRNVVELVKTRLCARRSDRSEPPRDRSLTVEPALFLYMFGSKLSSAVLQNLVIARTCEALGHNRTVCERLQEFPEAEAEVQPSAAIINMTKCLLEALVPAALSLFLGPWSDHHGRRPLLLLPLLGRTLQFASYLAFTSDLARGWPIQSILLPCLFEAVSGGLVVLKIGSFCYLADVSSRDQRAWRMGLVEASSLIGLPLGLASSSFVLAWGGYGAVFALSSAANLLGLVYVFLFLPESVPRHRESCHPEHPPPGARSHHLMLEDANLRPEHSRLRGLFDCRLIAEMLSSCARQRPRMRRPVIFLVTAAMASFTFTLNGETSVAFLYTRRQFGWTIRQFSLFSSSSTVLTAIGSLVCLRTLSSWLRLPDVSLAALALFTKMAASTVLAAADNFSLLVLGSLLSVFGGLVGPLARTILSKNVPQQDIGKVFSVTSSLDALTPLFSVPAYTLLYNATFRSLPGAFYLLSAAIQFIDFVCVCAVAAILYKLPKLKPCEENKTEDEILSLEA